MPCIKCKNGKYKYGESGECKHTKKKCEEMQRAHKARKSEGKKK